MADKNSEKHNLDKPSQSTKSKLTNTPHHLNPDKIISSKTCDKNSTSLIDSLSSASSKPNFEGITLIWYDPQIDKTDDTKLTTNELREINDCVIQYSDQVNCVKCIQSVEKEKIFLITSGTAALSLLPEIESSKQVDSIFIFCFKVDKYQHLLKMYDRIVGIYYDRSALIDSIKQNVDLVQKHLIAFSFYNEHEEKATRDISKESAEFLWFQLFKDVLLQLPQSNQAKKELIDFCRQYYHGNKIEQESITEFGQRYQSDQSIYWYTKNSFLYRLVNKALRTEDVGHLQTFRFFISDLSSKLAEIHRKQIREYNTTVKLYRGLKLENDELERLKQKVGCIISANGFLSTSRSKKIAVKFAMRQTKRTNIVPVLYKIECNLNALESVVFADITEHSKFAEEKEVLFDLGSTFKMESISRDEQLKMIVVKLIATDAGMKTGQEYIKLNRKTKEETTPDILFGVLMTQMGKYDQSLSYFKNSLNESNDKVDEARISHEIGSAYLCKGELDKAFKKADWAYRRMIKIKRSRIKDSSRPLAIMAHVYLRRGMYEESLDLYFEALEVREKFYGRKHLDTASALNNVGNTYLQKEDYPISLEYYQKAFHIFKEQLPDDHFYTAVSLNNLGLVHWKMDNVNPALDCHRKALKIRKQLLPPDHNHIIQSLHNLTDILYKEGRIDESLEYFTQLLTIEKIKFDPNDHENLVNRLEEYFRLRSPDTLVIFASTDHAHVIRWMPVPRLEAMSGAPNACQRMSELDIDECVYTEDEGESVYSENEGERMHAHGHSPDQIHTSAHVTKATMQLPIVDKKQIELKKQEDLAILKDFIKTLDSDSDYHSALKNVRKILMTSSEYCISGYNHTEYLLTSLGHLAKNAYDSDDKSMKAFHFYDKVRFILANKISQRTNTKYAQDMCSKRIKQKKIHDRSILKELVDILDNGGDYNMALEKVKELLNESSQPFTSGYNHTEYLMACLGDLVKNAYDSDDNSMKAFHFCDKVRFILESKISHWANTKYAQDMCSKRIKQKKIHDRSILKELIDILDNGGGYDMALETVKELLNESSQPFTSGYNHTEYLMKCLHTLVMNAHDSNDESIEALNFYEKVQFILETVISLWANTDHIRIVFLERIGHIRQINSRYQLAVESFERSVKMQREHEKSLIDVPDTLRCIGLLHMALGNHKSALASFNKTLKLLQSNPSQKDREIRLLYKRIDQATEGLKLVMDSLE